MIDGPLAFPELNVIDVAHWDAPIDVHAMIDAGAIGLYAKATTGAGGVDSAFPTFRAQATSPDVQAYCRQKHGCPFHFGAYGWLNGDDAHAQVTNFLNHTQGLLWRIWDFEALNASLTTAVLATHILHDKTGIWPTMYGGDKAQLGDAIDQGHFASVCPIILARDFPRVPFHPCQMWQYAAGERPNEASVKIGGKSFDLNSYHGEGTCADWLSLMTGLR
jgi:hypothetical protein